MGIKALWLGLTLIQTDSVWHIIPSAGIVGAVFMVIGVILLILDK